MSIRDMALTYGCSRVQFWLGMFEGELIKQLHGVAAERESRLDGVAFINEGNTPQSVAVPFVFMLS